MTIQHKTNPAQESAAKRGVEQPAAQINRTEHVRPAVALKRAIAAPLHARRPSDIQSLQRTIGNQAVLRLLTKRRPTQAPATIQRKEIVGTTFDETRPTQEKIHPQVVDFLAEKIKKGEYDEDYTLEVKNMGTEQESLEDSHHRFVAGHKADKPFPRQSGGVGPAGFKDWSEVKYDENMFDFIKWRIMRNEYDHDEIQAALDEVKTKVDEEDDPKSVWDAAKFYDLKEYNRSFIYRRDLNKDFWTWVDSIEGDKREELDSFLGSNEPPEKYKGPIDEDHIGY